MLPAGKPVLTGRFRIHLNLGNTTENLHADCVQSRQAGFVRYCLWFFYIVIYIIILEKELRVMSKIYQGAVELIGNTPLVEVTNLEKKQELKARVLVKLEYLNPAGSVKDRIAKAMLEDAEQKGKLKEGSVIIEPTSGNTGIGLAAIAASKGYRVIL